MPDSEGLTKQQNEVKEVEKKIETYKREAMLDIQKAQEEKDSPVWMMLVNDPASYFAARNMIGLKGIEMSSDQFEEIAALFIHLTRKAILKHAIRKQNSQD